MYKLGKRNRPSEPLEGNNKVQITDSVKRTVDSNTKTIDSRTKTVETGIKDPKKSQDLLSLFTSCMTALSTNKICSKNAFEVGIIDHMDDLVQLQGDSEDEDELFGGTKRVSFTTASRVVEGACKVYGYRVEALYDKTYSVLMNVHSVNKTDAPKATRKNKITKTGSLASTLAPESEVTLNELPVDDISLDPYFLKISSLFDQSGAQGLLLNNLIINKDLSINLQTETDVSTHTTLASPPHDGHNGRLSDRREDGRLNGRLEGAMNEQGLEGVQRTTIDDHSTIPEDDPHEGSNGAIERAFDNVDILEEKTIGQDRSYRSISTTSDFENLQIADTSEIGDLTIEVTEPLVTSVEAIVSPTDANNADSRNILVNQKGTDTIPMDNQKGMDTILVDGQKIYEILANWSFPLDFKSQFFDSQEMTNELAKDVYLDKLAKMQILPELDYFKRELETINAKIYKLKNPNVEVDEETNLEITNAPFSDTIDAQSSSDYDGQPKGANSVPMDDHSRRLEGAHGVSMDNSQDGHYGLEDAHYGLEDVQEFSIEQVSLVDRLDAIDIEGATKFSFYKKAETLYKKTVKPFFIKKEFGSPKSPEYKVDIKSEMSLAEYIREYLGNVLVDELDTIELSIPTKIVKKQQDDAPDFTTCIYKFDNRFFTTLNVCENRLVKLSNDSQWLFDESRDNPVIQIIYTGPELSIKSIESDSCNGFDEYMDCIEGVMDETSFDIGGIFGEPNVSGYVDILKIKKMLSDIIHEQATDDVINFERAISATLERLSIEEKEALSSHVLFVCLLHVCNEQNLLLQQPEPLQDFQIIINASTEQHAKCA